MKLRAFTSIKHLGAAGMVAGSLGIVGLSTAAGAAPAQAARPATPACATSSLSVTVGPALGDAGHADIPLVFTNKGRTTCTLVGYPGVSVVGNSGNQLGAPAERTTSPTVPVTLSPRQAAKAHLFMDFAGNYPARTCRPVTGQGFRVYPPNQRAAAFVPDQVQTCANPSMKTMQVERVEDMNAPN